MTATTICIAVIALTNIALAISFADCLKVLAERIDMLEYRVSSIHRKKED